jgi:hypothetical protein
LSASVPSRHTQFSVDFITNIAESNFRYTQVFAKLKTLLRKTAERTIETTWKRIGTLLDAFAPQECANYSRSVGYAST